MHTFFCHPVGYGQCQLKMFVFSDKGICMTLTLSSIVDVPSQPYCCLSSSILSLSMPPHHICIFSAITHAAVSHTKTLSHCILQHFTMLSVGLTFWSWL